MLSMKTPSKVHAVVISDVHLGHPRTTTAEIISGLRYAFKQSLLDGLDYVFIAGDLFDRDLSVPQLDVHLIFDWWSDFLKQCQMSGVKIRVLEGTPSHDYRQFALFGRINQESKIGADCRYIDDLRVETDEDTGLTVLYLPDEYSDTCAETEVKIRELLHSLEIEQVDLVIMHGQFNHQFPEMIASKLDCHDAEFFLSIARHYVCVGHVHTFSQYKRIIAQGSFDRLCHGMEEPKGMIRLMLDMEKPKSSACTFLENVHAKQYVTIVIPSDQSLDEATYRLHQLAQNMLSDAYIRVQGPADHPVFGTLSDFKRDYPAINWSSKRESVDHAKEVSQNVPTLAEIRGRVSINPENLRELILKRLTNADDVTSIMGVLTHVGVT